MALLDWFKRPNEVSYNSKYEPTYTIGSTGYTKEFPVSYYYSGFLLNSSSLYTIQVIILKNDGYEIGPLTMEPTTKLSLAGIDVKQLVVIQPSSLNSGTTTGATFRYDMIGTTQVPLPGYQLIDIAPYQKTVISKSVSLLSTDNPISSIPINIYTVPSGYKLKVYNAWFALDTLSTAGNRQVVLGVRINNSVFRSGTALADTGSVSTTATSFYAIGGAGEAPSSVLNLPNHKWVSWNSPVEIGAGNALGFFGQLQSGDVIPLYSIDAELVQI